MKKTPIKDKVGKPFRYTFFLKTGGTVEVVSHCKTTEFIFASRTWLRVGECATFDVDNITGWTINT